MVVLPIKRRRTRRVAILYGAVAQDAGPDEQDVLVQVEAVQQALTQLGLAPVPVPMTLDLASARARLSQIRPAFVFNLVESLEGQGRFIHLAHAVVDQLGLPHTGSAGDALFLTSKKPLAKRMLTSAAIATPPWAESGAVGADGPEFPGPYIVKSVWEHASIGLDAGSVLADGRKLAGLLRRRQRQFGGEWFVERYVEGREFNLALLAGAAGVELLPPAEMCFVGYPADKPRIVDYAAKWHEGSFEYCNTVRRFEFGPEDAPLLAMLEAIARDCWRLFDLHGHVRVDCRVDTDGRPWVLEINLNPCLSPDAGFMAAAGRAGLDLPQVVERVVADLSQAQPAQRPAESIAPKTNAAAG